MRRSHLVVALAAYAVMLFSSSMVLAADNWLGTWKLNVEKSTFSPGWPAPKSLTLKFEASEGGIRFTSDGISAEGTATHSAFSSKYDGKTLTISLAGKNAKGEAVNTTNVCEKQ